MYPLGRQDLTQQGAGKSWVGVLPSSDLRSRAGKVGCGRYRCRAWLASRGGGGGP